MKNQSARRIGWEKESYRGVLAGLVRRYVKATGKADAWRPTKEDHWVAMAEWLDAAVRETVSGSTWVVYRSAVASGAGEVPRVKQILMAGAKRRKSDVVEQNAAKRKKHLSDDDYRLLGTWLKRSKRKHRKDVMMMLRASRLCGLRPQEWRGAKYGFEEFDGQVVEVLIVKSLKRGTGRAALEFESGMTIPFLPIRKIPIDHLDEFDRGAVSYTIGKCSGLSEEQWRQYYRGLRRDLAAAVTAAFRFDEERITMYSARHQYVADLKRSGLSPLAQMLLVGHTSEATARHHYGRKIRGVASWTSDEGVEEYDRMVRALNGFGALDTVEDEEAGDNPYY